MRITLPLGVIPTHNLPMALSVLWLVVVQEGQPRSDTIWTHHSHCILSHSSVGWIYRGLDGPAAGGVWFVLSCVCPHYCCACLQHQCLWTLYETVLPISVYCFLLTLGLKSSLERLQKPDEFHPVLLCRTHKCHVSGR